MKKLKMRGVQRHAADELLGRFRAVIFPVADERVAYGRKLRPNLVLQPGHEFNPDQRGIRQNTLDGEPEFRASRFRIFRAAQLLERPLPSQVVHERSARRRETAPHDCKILPDRNVAEKLPYERVSICMGLSEQQYPGSKAIDAMHDLRPPQFKRGRKHRQSRGHAGDFDWHRQQSGRLVNHDQGFVLIKHGQFAGEARAARTAVGRVGPSRITFVFFQNQALSWSIFNRKSAICNSRHRPVPAPAGFLPGRSFPVGSRTRRR